MNISKTGFWKGEEAKQKHVFDSGLANAVYCFLKEQGCRSVVDIGSGLGDYVKFFISNGIESKGIEGNPDTNKISNYPCEIKDLSAEVVPKKVYDWAVSLEVGEHIPSEFESRFIENVHNHNRFGVVLSWATEGQGGDGHVNERPNSYIKSIFEGLGYENLKEKEEQLRSKSTKPWFSSTIMIFKKKKT